VSASTYRKGWQYCVWTLDDDLEVRAHGGQARVVLDELENSYQRTY
jgi:hypothetical protein